MKKTGFKQKTLDEVRAKQAAKRLKSPAKALKRTKTKKATDPSKKVIQKGYKPPSWFMSIPLGSHGNSPVQKRYWKVVTDLCRQRDFNKYGKCVSCPFRFEKWNESQGGHYIPWGSSNAWFKFSTDNVHGQCSSCNYALKKSAADVGYAFGKELVRRYGEHHLTVLATENNANRGLKLDPQEIVRRVENLLEQNPWFVLP